MAQAKRYWVWSDVYNDHYHRNSDGSKTWAKKMDDFSPDSAYTTEEDEPSFLPRHPTLSSTSRKGSQKLAFTMAPIAAAHLNRSIAPEHGSNLANRVSAKYQISFSPDISNAFKNSRGQAGLAKGPKKTLEAQRLVKSQKKALEGQRGHRIMISPPTRLVFEQDPKVKISFSRKLAVVDRNSVGSTTILSPVTLHKDVRTISYIRLMVHDSSSTPSYIPTSKNHWSLYLLLSGNQGCIHLNTTLSQTGQGNLDWIFLSHAFSMSRLHSWDFRVVPGVTVGDFVRMVYRNGKGRYWGGGGKKMDCRFWLYSVIEDMVPLNWVFDAQAAERIWGYMQYFYDLGGKVNLDDVDLGEFY